MAWTQMSASWLQALLLTVAATRKGLLGAEPLRLALGAMLGGDGLATLMAYVSAASLLLIRTGAFQLAMTALSARATTPNHLSSHTPHTCPSPAASAPASSCLQAVLTLGVGDGRGWAAWSLRSGGAQDRSSSLHLDLNLRRQHCERGADSDRRAAGFRAGGGAGGSGSNDDDGWGGGVRAWCGAVVRARPVHGSLLRRPARTLFAISKVRQAFHGSG